MSFAYDSGPTVLKDVSLEAQPGQTVALVGPTGAGKTTLVGLILRFYDVSGGQVLIAGGATDRDHGWYPEAQKAADRFLGRVLRP